MGRIRIYSSGGRARSNGNRTYDYTILLVPVFEAVRAKTPARKRPSPGPRFRNPVEAGFQVTVPMLPGIVTFGRTEAEAIEMARDAISCHIEGLREPGESIPDER